MDPFEELRAYARRQVNRAWIVTLLYAIAVIGLLGGYEFFVHNITLNIILICIIGILCLIGFQILRIYWKRVWYEYYTIQLIIKLLMRSGPITEEQLRKGIDRLIKPYEDKQKWFRDKYPHLAYLLEETVTEN